MVSLAVFLHVYIMDFLRERLTFNLFLKFQQPTQCPVQRRWQINVNNKMENWTDNDKRVNCQEQS